MSQRKYKDIDLNDTVTVELPVEAIIRAATEYGAADWSGPGVTEVLHECQVAILHPIYVNELEARFQQEQEQYEAAANRFLGLPPDIPPHMEGL